MTTQAEMVPRGEKYEAGPARTVLFYHLADLLFSVFTAGAACAAVMAVAPAGGGPPLRMAAGMAAGMILGNVLALIFSLVLGMFETMYLGCFAGMAGGMIGAMATSMAWPLCALYGLLTGAAVWAGHAMLNRHYRRKA